MNWLYRSIKIAQQTIPLSMESLKGLRESPQAQPAASILRMFNNLFQSLPHVFTDTPIISEMDTSQLSPQMFEAIKTNDGIAFETWDEAWKFMKEKNVHNSDWEHSLKLSFDFNGLRYSDDRNINGPTIDNRSPSNGTWPDDAPQFLDEVLVRLEPLSGALEAGKADVAEIANIMARSDIWSRRDIRKFYDVYIESKSQLKLVKKGYQTGSWMGHFNQLMDRLAEYSRLYMDLMSKDESNNNVVPPLPPLYTVGEDENVDADASFVKEQLLMRKIKGANINAATRYFIDKRPELVEELLDDTRRIHEENETNEYNIQKREFDHQFGYAIAEGNVSWLELFKQTFNASNNEDARLELTAKQLSDMAHRLEYMNKVSGAAETGQVISSYVVGIQMTAFQDQGMTAVLGNNLEYAPDRQYAIAGIHLAQRSGLPLPEVFENEPNPSMLVENHYNDMQDFFADMRRNIKQRVYRYSREDIEKMKELGIAKKIPDLDYSVKEDNYPGQGWVRDLPSTFTSFVISFAPTNDQIVEKDIPKSLLTDFNVHHLIGPGQNSGRQQPGVADVPPIGWVGGFVDPVERSMYVFELQSDLMQNTNQMRDPRKVEDERKVRRDQLNEEIKTLQQQIEEVKQQALQPKPKKNPMAGLKTKIKRIENDIAKEEQNITELSSQKQQLESQPNFDPNAGQYVNLQQTIDAKLKKLQGFNTQKERMEQNLARISDPAETGAPSVQSQEIDQQSQQKIDKMEKRIQKANQEIQDSRSPIPRYDKPQWHDYRNVIENTFADWIKIFWNTAVREAVRNNMNYLYIITADSLFQLWRFGGENKKVLFERVYDGYGQNVYGGEKVQKHNFEFWKINLRQPDLKVASGWLTQVVNRLPKFGSLFPIIEPSFVLSESGISSSPTVYVFPIPADSTTSTTTV